ncbi:MAG: RnfH family protein [Gammaproteobacteria bacterium]
MTGAEILRIEVVYALPDTQHVIAMQLAAGASVRTAIERSGLLQKFPEIRLAHDKVGIFGRVAKLDDGLDDGDRLEIYRPLVRDPKEARRELAARGKTMGRG